MPRGIEACNCIARLADMDGAQRRILGQRNTHGDKVPRLARTWMISGMTARPPKTRFRYLAYRVPELTPTREHPHHAA
jgi:hypothetical protein